MEDKELNPAQSLDLIQSMIHTAKNKLADDGFLTILWGWLVFSASLISYACWRFEIPYSGLPWMVLMPAGAIISIVYSRKKDKHEKVRTYVDSYLGYIWTAFAICLGLALIFMPYHGLHATYFFLMMLYGIATFCSGGLLSFRPLMIGSFFSFGLAAISVFVPEPEHLLLLALSMLCSYIIPGHLLKLKYQSQQDV